MSRLRGFGVLEKVCSASARDVCVTSMEASPAKKEALGGDLFCLVGSQISLSR